MALPSSGPLSIDNIRTELSSSSGSLRTLSSAAGKSTPDAISEFYGYSSFSSLPTSTYNLANTLHFSIQADDPACYSGTGTVLNDTSGVSGGTAANSKGTLYGGASWVSTGGKYWYCDGVNDYINIDPLKLPRIATYVTVARSPTTNWNNNAGLGSSRRYNGFIIHNNINTTNWNAYYYGASTAQISLIGSGLSSTPSDWSMYTIVTHDPYDSAGRRHRAYYNNTLVASSTATNTRSIDPYVGTVINLGRDDNYAVFNEIEIHAFLMYQSGLTSTEITTLWNYFNAKLP